MSENETIQLFGAPLPQDNPEGKKERTQRNKLQDQMIKHMRALKYELSDVHKGTSIPFTTLYSWYMGTAKVQLADHRLPKLAKFLGLTLEELLFGPISEINNNDKTA